MEEQEAPLARPIDPAAGDLLFVYGTLMSGFDNAFAASLRQAAALVGPATLPGRMHVVRGPRGALVYPAVVPPEDPAELVHGELYRVSHPAVFESLDRYEGAEYERVRRGVSAASGERDDAWVYLFRGDVTVLPRIPSGRFGPEGV